MIKSTTKKSGAASPVVTDIPHEEVKHSDNGVSIAAKVITPEDQIKIEIQKFDIAEAGIAVLKEKYGALVITGPEDKSGYKAVREAWRDVQSKRTGLEKKGLELRNGYGVITKGIKKKQDDLVELITPLEDDLYGKWKAIDEEKERLQKEAEAEEHRQMMIRVEEVLGLGMEFNGGFYCVGDSISMDVATLRALPVDQYEKLKDKIVAKVKEIAEAKAAELEKQRLENERVEKEKAELLRQQNELKEQQAEMERQRAELENQKKQAAKVRTENRLNRLLGLGMTKTNDYSVSFDNGFLSFTSMIDDFKNMTDSEFETYYKDHEEGITDRNKRKADHEEQVNQEKAAKAEKEKLIAEKMQEIDMSYNYRLGQYEFINEFLTLTATWDILLPMDDKKLNQFTIDAGAAILTAKKQAEIKEKERKYTAEKEANNELNDKQRYETMLRNIKQSIDLMQPDLFKSVAYRKKAIELKNYIENLISKK